MIVGPLLTDERCAHADHAGLRGQHEPLERPGLHRGSLFLSPAALSTAGYDSGVSWSIRLTPVRGLPSDTPRKWGRSIQKPQSPSSRPVKPSPSTNSSSSFTISRRTLPKRAFDCSNIRQIHPVVLMQCVSIETMRHSAAIPLTRGPKGPVTSFTNCGRRSIYRLIRFFLFFFPSFTSAV